MQPESESRAIREAQAKQLAQNCIELENCIITGDFNAEKESPVVQEFMEKYNSAQYMSTGNENEYTTCKHTKDGLIKRAVDFVFTSKENERGLGITNVARYLQMPDPDTILPCGNPNAAYPSDHYALGYEFIVEIEPSDDYKENDQP